MIKVFSGQWRGLGEKKQGLGMLLSFEFRTVLHEFRGARLSIFMDIALHSDEKGFSFPGYDCMERETGYNPSTISQALKDLCQMKINGQRVLLRYRERNEFGQFTGSNRYLIFPTQEELSKYGDPDLENPRVDHPDLENPSLVFSTCGEIQVEVKPDSKVKPDSLTNTGACAPAPLIRNQGAFAALQTFEKNHKPGEADFSGFPENSREIIREFCRLWNIRPPSKTGKRGGEFSLWIGEAVELADACGEFGLKALARAADDYKKIDIEKRFTVARPGSVVRFVRSTAGKMRDEAGRADARAKKVDSFELFREKQAYLFPDQPVTELDYKHYLMSQGVRG